MSPGNQASESEAAAPMAACVALEAMRRRVCLSRLAVLTAIAAGPVALGVAIISAPTTAGAAAAAKPTAGRTTAAAADPPGCAQLFVGAWLLSSAGDATSAQARRAQSMASDVELPGPVAGAQSKPQSVIAVRSAQREGGTWSVTVAAHHADGSVCYYADGAGETGDSFTPGAR
ncbi:hypothetical protein OHB25_38975 [Streptomyces mirabilis]|uniref:hypothetical protein n=1 Tax=Streptomyces mirabilis TaxID=68239 RepID=UPI002E2020D5